MKNAMIKVYKYGCRLEAWQASQLWDVGAKANQYFNALIASHNEIMKLYPDKEERGGMTKEELAEVKTEVKGLRLAGQRACRKESGIHYGTYCLVEDAVKRATKGQRVAKFSAWRNRRSFRIGTPLNNGQKLPVAEVETDRRFRLEPFEQPRTRIVTKRDGRQVEVGRFGTHHAVIYHQGQSNDPLRVVVKISRPLPQDGMISQVWLQMRRSKFSHVDCDLIVVVRAESHAPVPQAGGQSRGEIGMDLGWRVQGDRIRVAYTSNHDEILTPPKLRSRLKKSESLRGIADRETALAWKRYCGEIPQDDNGRPWAVGRMANQLRIMATQDQDVWHDWHKQDRHLRDWAAALDERARRSRKQHYRLEARKLCEKYGKITLEALDLRPLARSKTGGDARFEAAPGEWMESLKCVAPAFGTVLEFKSSTNTTRICHACGHLNPGGDSDKKRRKLIITCEDCGETYDQDYNAGQVLKDWDDCVPCKGRGRLGRPKESPRCEACDGKGKVPAQRPPESLEDQLQASVGA